MGLSVVLVGNGPLRSGLAREIDGFDVVVRFNACTTYGNGGLKTDVLAIVNTGAPGFRFGNDPAAIHATAKLRAARFLLTKSPRLIASYPGRMDRADLWQDHSEAILMNVVRARPWAYISHERYLDARSHLLQRGAPPYTEPSTGFVVLWHYRSEGSATSIALAGFTHQGWTGHSWLQEKRSIAEWRTTVNYL